MSFSYNLTTYTPLFPPCQLNYDDWSHKEATDYLTWFVKRVPERAEYIIKFVSTDTREPNLPQMVPRDKLIYIWRWFLQIAETELIDEEELSAQAPFRAKFGPSSRFCGNTRFTAKTEYILRDIGMLFAQLLMQQSEHLTWTVVSTPRRYVFVNRPILTGFLDTRYTPAFKAETDPLHLVRVQAAALLINEPATDIDLAKIFDVWVAQIPK